MNTRRSWSGLLTVIVAAMVTLLAAGCGGGDNNSSSGGLPGPTPTSTTRYFAYITNATTQAVRIFQVQSNASTISVGSQTGLNQPQGMVGAPNGAYLFVADAGLNQVLSYRIDPTGGTLGSYQVVDFPTAREVAIDPLGRFLYVAGGRGNGIGSFLIDPSTAVLTAGSTLAGAADITPTSIAPDPAGRFVFTPWLISGPFGVNPHLDVYAPQPGSGAFALNSTSATNLPYRVTPHPNGLFAYLTQAEPASAGVEIHSVNNSTGALTLVQTLATGATPPLTLAVNPRGNALYVADSSGSLITYTVDSATGVLSSGVVTTLPAPAIFDTLSVDQAGSILGVLLNDNSLFTASLGSATGAVSVTAVTAVEATPVRLFMNSVISR